MGPAEAGDEERGLLQEEEPACTPACVWAEVL
jgi:hypothetical protein